MDKAIIDNVDVSECSYYSSETYPYTCEVWDNECEAQNCYFKQFQRARAEIEQLKSDIESRTMCITCEREMQNYNLQAENERLKKDKIGLHSEIKQLEQENERLKSIVEINNQQVEQAELLVMDNDRLQQEVENLKDTIYYDVEKYRQALQEIREELEEDITCESRECGCDDYGECLNCLKETILDKINEVIGVEE